MILIRVEPENIGPLGMDAPARKEAWLSSFREDQKARMGALYDKNGMEHVVGCWFSPAMRRTNGKLDALIYANEIIGPDHNFNSEVQTNLRIIAFQIDDDTAQRFKVSNLDKTHYARFRSAIPEGEYLVPNDIPQQAKQILVLAPGEILTEERYITALTEVAIAPTRPRVSKSQIAECVR